MLDFNFILNLVCTCLQAFCIYVFSLCLSVWHDSVVASALCMKSRRFSGYYCSVAIVAAPFPAAFLCSAFYSIILFGYVSHLALLAN